MKEYQIEDNEVVIVLGPDKMDLYAPMMEKDAEIPETGIPEHVQFATALVYLTKTDMDFRRWITEKWFDLVERFREDFVEKEVDDEVQGTPEV